jgi:hypothetical protein
MFGSTNKLLEKQHNAQMQANAEANDNNVLVNFGQPNENAYDAQVSAKIITVDTRFLPMRFIPLLDEKSGQILFDDNNQPKGRWVVSNEHGYQEPYGDEALAFIEELDERKLLNRFGGGLGSTYTFSEKYSVSMKNTFNYFVRMRKDQILNTRSTGRPSKLAKSQIVDSTANINRQMVAPKKKGFLGGWFG